LSRKFLEPAVFSYPCSVKVEMVYLVNCCFFHLICVVIMKKPSLSSATGMSCFYQQYNYHKIPCVTIISHYHGLPVFKIVLEYVDTPAQHSVSWYHDLAKWLSYYLYLLYFTFLLYLLHREECGEVSCHRCFRCHSHIMSVGKKCTDHVVVV